MRAITATVTPGSANLQALINIDNYATAVLGVQIVALGGASYSLSHSFDDPNDLISPVPVASMYWGQSLVPSPFNGAPATASGSFQIMAAPLWFRLLLINAQGSVRATFAQIGEHSHSNITQGPFAPLGAVDDEVLEGSNFRAMGK
jgi:hypothetical protein